MEVADEIVVMNHGRTEQVGAPADVYEKPANEFVMGFVGQAHLVGERWVHRRPGGLAWLGGARAAESGRRADASTPDTGTRYRCRALQMHPGIRPRGALLTSLSRAQPVMSAQACVQRA